MRWEKHILVFFGFWFFLYFVFYFAKKLFAEYLVLQIEQENGLCQVPSTADENHGSRVFGLEKNCVSVPWNVSVFRTACGEIPVVYISCIYGV